MIELSPNLKRTLNGTLLVLVLGLILWALGPVLTPFIVAAVLAYALNPLVDRISGWLGGRVPRWLAVVLVMLVFILAVLGVAMLIVPVVIKEGPIIRQQLPVLLDRGVIWVQQMFDRYGIPFEVNLGSLRGVVIEWLSNSSSTLAAPGEPSFVKSLLNSLMIGGSVALSVIGNLVLIPIALFYLLLDWDKFIATVFRLVPLRMREGVTSFVQEADTLLGQYLRGQLLVMIIMATYYSVGLMLFGLDLAWPVGIFTGLAVFVPYLGFGVGTVIAVVLGLLQFGLTKTLIMVGVVYTSGQMIESYYFTPRLVGERIGLHPLVVIFALLAFGQLFGFVGVLVALPCSAVLLVAVRRLRERYFRSDLYNN